MTLRVLHIYKKEYRNTQQYYLGSVKDIRSRTEYFHERGIVHEEFIISGKFFSPLDFERASSQIKDHYDAVIMEMTFSPYLLRILRKITPNAILMVRSHNAELFHRIHWALAQGASPTALRFLFQAIKNFALDIFCAKLSDFILSISPWEADRYWKRIASPGKVKYVPFFLPNSYVKELRHDDKKRKLCVHLGSGLNNPLIADATKNFLSAVKSLDSDFADWEFMATGAAPPYVAGVSAPIQWIGVIPDPYRVLRSAKAMALLSDYGMGVKTKIVEAALARCFIILPKILYNRQPDEIRPYCIPIDLKSKGYFAKALVRSCIEFPAGDPNLLLRRKAFAVLDNVMGTAFKRKKRASEPAAA